MPLKRFYKNEITNSTHATKKQEMHPILKAFISKPSIRGLLSLDSSSIDSSSRTQHLTKQNHQISPTLKAPFTHLHNNHTYHDLLNLCQRDHTALVLNNLSMLKSHKQSHFNNSHLCQTTSDLNSHCQSILEF